MRRILLIWKKNKNLLIKRIFLSCLLIGILCAGLVILSFLLSASWQVVLLGAVISAAAFCGLLHSVYTVYLPYRRTGRLLNSLDTFEETEHEGIYLGEKSACTMRDGVRMRVLRIDAGERVRGEPVESEPEVPAVFSVPLTPGTAVRYTAVRGVLTGIEADCDITICLSDGQLSVPGVQYFAAVLLALILWPGVYEIRHQLTAPKTTEIAVCTLAYHSESEAVLSLTAKENGLSFSYAYTTTLDDETVYQYLATYGTYEAEILLLPAYDYLSAMDSDTPVLALPDGVRALTNADGKPVAAILYDPADPDYSARFASIADWIAIPKDDLYVLSIGPNANGTASGAASLLLSALSQDIFPKE